MVRSCFCCLVSHSPPFLHCTLACGTGTSGGSERLCAGGRRRRRRRRRRDWGSTGRDAVVILVDSPTYAPSVHCCSVAAIPCYQSARNPAHDSYAPIPHPTSRAQRVPCCSVPPSLVGAALMRPRTLRAHLFQISSESISASIDLLTRRFRWRRRYTSIRFSRFTLTDTFSAFTLRPSSLCCICSI